MIEVTVNGQPQQIDAGLSIAELLEIVDIPGPYLAVEINEDIVPRDLHDEHRLKADDRIEVVTLVGGG